MKNFKILVRTEGYANLGMGNIYRDIRLIKKFQELYGGNFKFLVSPLSNISIRKIKDTGFEVDIVKGGIEGYLNNIRKFNPDCIINDILDLEEEYIKKLRELNVIIVNFEDTENTLTRKYANIIFNSLFEDKKTKVNYYYGPKYAPLDESFKDIKPKQINKICRKFILTFGGSDPSGFTLKVAKILNQIPGIKVTVFLGPSFNHYEKLYDLLKSLDRNKFIIKQDVNHTSKEFAECDIAIASGGNTCFGLAAAGVPIILLCQNELEVSRGPLLEKYKFLINIGDGNKLSDEDLLKNIKNLMDNFELRKEMSRNGKSLVDGYGVERIVEIIYNNLKNKFG